jgi:hypothetical protein
MVTCNKVYLGSALVVSFSGSVVGTLLTLPGMQLFKRDFRPTEQSTDPEKGSGELEPQDLAASLSVKATGEEDARTSRSRGGDHGDKIEEDPDESRL